MLYSELIIYRREINNPGMVVAYRISSGGGYASSVKLYMADLYRGHTEWIARDIEERANAPRRRYA